MLEAQQCTVCGGAVGEAAVARERVIAAAIAYALATDPNHHPVDVEFRRAISELTRCEADDRPGGRDSSGIGSG